MDELRKKYAVFIPCYNAAGTVKETIQSVQAAISKTGTPIPVYIYDDCSTDNSFTICSELIKGYNHFYINRNRQNDGERKTTNAAFGALNENFDWAFIIHADDIVKEDWLLTLIKKIETVDDQVCFTIWSSFDTLNDSTGKTHAGDNSGNVQQVIKNNDRIRAYLTKITSSWHLSGAAINVKLYLQLKGFDEKMPQLGDTDFFVRGLLAGYSDVYIARTLTFYRITDGSVTSNSYKTNRDIQEIYMLAQKHHNILTKNDVMAMYAAIRRMSARRMMKWLAKVKPYPALACFKQYVKSMVKSFQFKFGSQAAI